MHRIRFAALAAAAALAFGTRPASAQPAIEPAGSAAATGTASRANTALAGTIKDATGRPLRNIVVHVDDQAGAAVATVKSDQAGVLRFPLLPPGHYSISAETIELDPASRSLTIIAGPTPSIALTASVVGLENVQVVAQRLDQSRQALAPDLGADVYTFSRQDIQKLPAGAVTPLNDVLLQAPGVVQDSYGQLHVRGDHANLQYRINDIIIPESIGGFGQTLQTRFADRISLITGALPAQYGYRTAGVVSIDTKGGAFDKGGMIGIEGGSHNASQLYGDLGGTAGDFTYYVTGAWLQNDLGIEAPTSASNPLHDQTRQSNGFAYLSYHISGDTRLSLIGGAVANKFEIPNVPGQLPLFSLADTPAPASSELDANQTERTRYAALALQGSLNDATDYQVALFHRFTGVDYDPDPVGDLVYTGVAGTIKRQNEASGVQADVAWRLDGKNTVRSGLYLSHERLATDNTSRVFPADADGNQTSDIPFTIVDNTRGTSRLFGLYLQDEWRPLDTLTVNGGLRYDKVDTFVSEDQWSPRLGAVWNVTSTTTLHAGYARYFTPPPSELITSTTIDKYVGTTNAPATLDNSPVKSERSHYFDAGIAQKVSAELTLGLDGYYRRVTNLLDEGQFGSAILFTPFNYAEGRVYGVEGSANYRHGDFSAYANVAYSIAKGRDIVSSQYTFDPDELAYIQNHWIYLDHSQTWSASAGASYLWRDTTFSVTGIYGSGLRAGFANTESLPSYVQVDAGVAHAFELGAFGKLNARFTIINVFDKVYEIRDGTGIGVGAPQFGPRRAYYIAFEKPFKL